MLLLSVADDNRITGASARPDCRSLFVPRSPWNNMSADRKASFKQPPQHVINTALSQEVRRNKVCRLQDHVYNMLYSHDRSESQALEEQKRVRHIFVASESAIQCISYI
jgi:hypothetical protein